MEFATATDPASPPSNASLVAQMRPALVAFFRRRCGNAAEAEDLAHDVVVRALAHSESLSPAGASGYIFRIAVNRWRDRGRRLVSHGNCLPWDEQSALGVSDGFSPERLLGAQQELHHVLGAVEQLGPRTRDVLVRCRLDQMKHAEIARELGISVSAVEKHLVRAMAQLARFNGGTEAPAPRPRDHRGCLGGATTAGDQASKTNQPALRISAGDA